VLDTKQCWQQQQGSLGPCIQVSCSQAEHNNLYRTITVWVCPTEDTLEQRAVSHGLWQLRLTAAIALLQKYLLDHYNMPTGVNYDRLVGIIAPAIWALDWIKRAKKLRSGKCFAPCCCCFTYHLLAVTPGYGQEETVMVEGKSQSRENPRLHPLQSCAPRSFEENQSYGITLSLGVLILTIFPTAFPLQHKRWRNVRYDAGATCMCTHPPACTPLHMHALWPKLAQTLATTPLHALLFNPCPISQIVTKLLPYPHAPGSRLGLRIVITSSLAWTSRGRCNAVSTTLSMLPFPYSIVPNLIMLLMGGCPCSALLPIQPGRPAWPGTPPGGSLGRSHTHNSQRPQTLTITHPNVLCLSCSLSHDGIFRNTHPHPPPRPSLPHGIYMGNRLHIHAQRGPVPLHTHE
jgi:hypothetical protein